MEGALMGGMSWFIPPAEEALVHHRSKHEPVARATYVPAADVAADTAVAADPRDGAPSEYAPPVDPDDVWCTD